MMVLMKSIRTQLNLYFNRMTKNYCLEQMLQFSVKESQKPNSSLNLVFHRSEHLILMKKKNRLLEWSYGR